MPNRLGQFIASRIVASAINDLKVIGDRVSAMATELRLEHEPWVRRGAVLSALDELLGLLRYRFCESLFESNGQAPESVPEWLRVGAARRSVLARLESIRSDIEDSRSLPRSRQIEVYNTAGDALAKPAREFTRAADAFVARISREST